MENYICIGDIHGRFDLLELLLSKVSALTLPHKLVFLGDMVDRGPDSFKVVDRIRNLCLAGDAIALRGNHEGMMLEYYNKMIPNNGDIWLWNGGGKTIMSYGKELQSYGSGRFFNNFGKSLHSHWMKALPLYFETEKVFFSHAPVPKNYPCAPGARDFLTDANALTWTYLGENGEGTNEYDHGKLAVCGHVHALRRGLLEPRIFPHIIYADTGSGCGIDGRLSAIIITDGKYESFIQAWPGELTG